jgi:hypothetical protein
MKKRKSTKLEDQVDIQSITATYWCPYDEQIYSVVLKEIDYHFFKDQCGLCGTHANLSIDINCNCGHTHEKSIAGW